MRVFVAIVITITLLVSSASGIVRVKDTWDYGIKGGLTVTEHHGCSDCIEKSKIGFTGGIFGEYKSSPNFAIQPELLFVMKGWKIFGEHVKLNYIELPVLAKYKISGSKSIIPHCYAGPVGGILVSATIEGDDIHEAFQLIDFGLALGVGADFTAGTGKIVFDIRYTLGLTDMVDHDYYRDLGWPDPTGIKNSAIYISMGFGW